MSIILLAALAGLLHSQSTETKKARKAFVPPEYHLLDPLLARDEGCIKDLAKVSRMEGLEQRKMLAELLQYGCVQQFPGMHLVAEILAVQHYGEGKERVEFRKVRIMSAVGMEFRTGWVLFDSLISTDAPRKVLETQSTKK